jgi:hypothetical protein
VAMENVVVVVADVVVVEDSGEQWEAVKEI